MKKILVAITIFVLGVVGYANVVSAHHLVVTGETSCVREDGSWDWSASYTIPDEDWADGLTVQVTWVPSQSGTNTDNHVVVTANWVFSNQVSGSNSTKIYKGEKCPQETTTTTVPPTSTTDSVVTTTTVPVTTTSSPTSTVSPSTTALPTTTVQDTPTTTVAVPAETTTTTTVVPTVTEKTVPNIPTTPEDLPATGSGIWWIAVIAAICLFIGMLLYRKTRRV